MIPLWATKQSRNLLKNKLRLFLLPHIYPEDLLLPSISSWPKYSQAQGQR